MHSIADEELEIIPLAYNPRPPLTYGRHRLLSIQAWMSVTPRPTVAAKWESDPAKRNILKGAVLVSRCIIGKLLLIFAK